MSRVTATFLEFLVAAGDSAVSGTAARQYTQSIVGSTPVPTFEDTSWKQIGECTRRIWEHQARKNTASEVGRLFVLPAVVQVIVANPDSYMGLFDAIRMWVTLRDGMNSEVLELSRAIEQVVRTTYRCDARTCADIDAEFGTHVKELPSREVDKYVLTELYTLPIDALVDTVVKEAGGRRAVTKRSYFADRRLELLSLFLDVNVDCIVKAREQLGLVSIEDIDLCAREYASYLVGCAFERWDTLLATGDRELPTLPDPIAPLPASAPGAFQNEDLMPTLDERTAIPADGILVDDAAHTRDLDHCVRQIHEMIIPSRPDAFERELCEVLGVRSLREYLSKPTSFFADHLGRYSKSRRQAPIYWPLSTPSGAYTLWLYYHRLTDQTLYTCINDFVVDPKLKQVVDEAEGLRRKTDRSRDDERELERLTDLERELTDFRDELLRVARFWKPNLNDGVQITAAPLWKLFQHRPWQRKLKETWEKLEAGDYDWAHLAMSIWPVRVVPKCVTDRSLAIAHDLEDLFWVEDFGKWRNLNEPDEEIEEQKQRQRGTSRDRVRKLLEKMATDHKNEQAGDVYRHLAGSDWDDRELALLIWPERVAEKCWDDVRLAAKHGMELPNRRTKAKRKRFIEDLVSGGCPELAEQLAIACKGHDEPLHDLWRELANGDRDDEPLALSLWPDRVVKKCAANVELAQTHNIHRFLWVQHPTESWRRRKSPETEVENEVERRSKQ